MSTDTKGVIRAAKFVQKKATVRHMTQVRLCLFSKDWTGKLAVIPKHIAVGIDTTVLPDKLVPLGFMS